MPDPEFPFLLLTGRGTSAQWHTGTRTLKSAVLRHLYPQKVYFEINPWDAAQLDLGPGSLALIRSRRGSIVAQALVTCSVQRGHIFIPMHYPETNRLTLASFDPHSRQPSYKACAISVEKASGKRITPSRTGSETEGGNSCPL
jgi:anaerobic selenocysteine-containing dehydrogenase